MKHVGELLGRDLPCSCGKTHRVPIGAVCTDTRGIDLAAQIAALFGGRQALLLCDKNTGAANRALIQQLEAGGFSLTVREFCRDEPVVNDEAVLGAAVFAAGPGVDGIVAVGGGTMTDLGRFVGSRLGKPFALVMTCPSMDGFASDVAGMVVDGKKVIFKNLRFPDGIFGDPDIIRGAPRDLIKSGFGDMLGKKTALPDWVLSHHVTGEGYCPWTAGIMDEAANDCIAAVAGIGERQPRDVKTLTDALVLAGVCMALAQDTRPASGSEHLFSHYLVEGAVEAGRQPPSHGVTVGFGTLLSTLLYRYLLAEAAPPELEAVRDALQSFLLPASRVRQLLEVSGIGADPAAHLEGGDQALAQMIRDCSAPGKKYTILRYLRDNGLLENGIEYVCAHIHDREEPI